MRVWVRVREKCDWLGRVVGGKFGGSRIGD